MGEVHADDARDWRGGEHSEPRDSGGFWRSLPGVLTASGTFLAGLAGLAAVIVPHMTNASRDASARAASASVPQEAPAPAAATAPPPSEPPAKAASEPAPATAAEPAPAEPPAPASERYVAAFASDGFVVLRSQPSTAGAEIRRVLVGQSV